MYFNICNGCFSTLLLRLENRKLIPLRQIQGANKKFLNNHSVFSVCSCAIKNIFVAYNVYLFSLFTVDLKRSEITMNTCEKCKQTMLVFNIQLSFFFQQMISPNMRNLLFYILIKINKNTSKSYINLFASEIFSWRIVLFCGSAWTSRLKGLGLSKYFVGCFHSFYICSTMLIYILQSYSNITYHLFTWCRDFSNLGFRILFFL